MCAWHSIQNRCIVSHLLIIQESIAGNTTIGYRTCPKHILF